jgi:hypothetical protein
MVSRTALHLAGEVSQLLEERGVRAYVIGAIALAAHGYVRATEDVDLGIAVDPKELDALVAFLAGRLPGVAVTVEKPDGDDQLGGVIDVKQGGDDGDLVQIVNFDNAPHAGFPALVREAQAVPFDFPGGFRGRLVSAEDLVFFKLYAAGLRNLADIQELLTRTTLDLQRLRHLAERYRMQAELQAVLGKPEG